MNLPFWEAYELALCEAAIGLAAGLFTAAFLKQMTGKYPWQF